MSIGNKLKLTGAVLTTAAVSGLGVASAEAKPTTETRPTATAHEAGRTAVKAACVDPALAAEASRYANTASFQFNGRLVYQPPKNPGNHSPGTFLPIFNAPSQEFNIGEGASYEPVLSDSHRYLVVDNPYLKKVHIHGKDITYAIQTDEGIKCGWLFVDLAKAAKMGGLMVLEAAGKKPGLEPANVSALPHFVELEHKPSLQQLEHDSLGFGRAVNLHVVKNYVPHL
jgi:hypothetical protein